MDLPYLFLFLLSSAAIAGMILLCHSLEGGQR